MLTAAAVTVDAGAEASGTTVLEIAQVGNLPIAGIRQPSIRMLHIRWII